MSREPWTSSTNSRDPSNARDHARRRIAELTALINPLIAERQQWQAELDSIVYPVLTLPPEVTSLVFVHSKHEHEDRYIMTSKTAPLLLIQICRQWRTIAFATPSLWQHIAFGCGAMQNNRRELLAMWLKHSACLPMFISLKSPDDAEMQSLISDTLIHCHRWQEIMISSANFDGADHKFPILRCAKLSSLVDYLNPRTITLQNAPMLRTASVSLTLHDSVVHLPWPQLTTLRIDALGLTLHPAASCIPMLSHCSQLNALTFVTYGRREHSDDPATISQPHVTLQSLRSLNLKDGTYIVPHLTLPHLQHLMFNGKIGAAIEAFDALWSRSSCALQTLDLTSDSSASELSLRLFYALTPTIINYRISSVSLDTVVASLSSADILPLMQNLVIELTRVPKHYDSLLNVLRSRLAADGDVGLKSFQLLIRFQSYFRPLPEPVMAQFSDLAAGGLKILIHSYRHGILLNTFGR